MNKQQMGYKPQIKYESNYFTNGESLNEQNIMIGPQSNKLPLDTSTIPSIEENLVYLSSALRALPLDLSRALHEVYDPIKDIFYTTLIDKIIDPNPQIPEIVFKPNITDDPNIPQIFPDPDKEDDKDDNKEDDKDDAIDKSKIHPIALYPINFGNKDEEDDKDLIDKSQVHPIVLYPIKDANEGGDDSDDSSNIESPKPIILHPIPGGSIIGPGGDGGNGGSGSGGSDNNGGDNGGDNNDNNDTDNDNNAGGGNGSGGNNGGGDGNGNNIGDDTDDDDLDGENGLWEEPSIDVEYLRPDLATAVDKEFVYLLSKVIKHYTDSLRDIINNYYYNSLRQTLNESEENISFIVNNLVINSNDILNHSKHLLDVSVKNENTASLRTDFFKNSFGIKNTLTHIRSFFVSYELRKRYTTISYSKGSSMSNSMSDSLLKQANVRYEMQFRKSFECFFRYLESSLKVTNDIFSIHIQNGLAKSVIIKKGGIR